MPTVFKIDGTKTHVERVVVAENGYVMAIDGENNVVTRYPPHRINRIEEALPESLE